MVSTTPLGVSITKSAELLGVTRDVIYDLIRDGRLRRFQITERIVRIPMADVLALVGGEPDSSSEAS